MDTGTLELVGGIVSSLTALATIFAAPASYSLAFSTPFRKVLKPLHRKLVKPKVTESLGAVKYAIKQVKTGKVKREDIDHDSLLALLKALEQSDFHSRLNNTDLVAMGAKPISSIALLYEAVRIEKGVYTHPRPELTKDILDWVEKAVNLLHNYPEISNVYEGRIIRKHWRTQVKEINDKASSIAWHSRTDSEAQIIQNSKKKELAV